MEGSNLQRASTPTMDGNSAKGSAVRGKMLSYNSSSNKRQGSTGIAMESPVASAVSPTLAGQVPSGRAPVAPTAGTAKKTATYILAPNSALDMNIQGRNASSGGISNSGRFNLSKQGSTSSQNEQYMFSTAKGSSDLEPLSDDIPADGVIFARSRTGAASLVVFRTQEEKQRNPERLNLDRRQLDVCPLLKNEQKLRLLNYQNNNIRIIANLENLPNLIFLDLYNNKLTSLEGPLSMLRGLRVLMVGKNRLTEISNLSNLRKLDVLDLHSNDIGEISGLDGLSELRVLNLAGNRITTVVNLNHLASLTELNLRRNSIEKIFDLDAIPSLQRIFLSHNLIKYMSDIKCLFSLKCLVELSLDGNPISSQDNAKYRSSIIAEISGLKHLDLQKITDEERRPAPAAIINPIVTSDNSGSNSQQSQLLHLSKFLDAMGGINVGSMSHLGSSPEMGRSRIGTANGRRGSFARDIETPNNVDTQKISSNSGSTTSAVVVNNVKTDVEDTLVKSNVNAGEEMDTQSNFGTIGLLKMSSSGFASGANTNGNNKNAPASATPPERVAKMNSMEVFDVPGVENKKYLHAMGEQWEWTQTRRALSFVVSAVLEKMRYSVLVHKFMNHAVLMPTLKKLTLNENEIKNFLEIKTLGNIFKTVEHLNMSKQPVEDTTPALLRAIVIVCFPNLKSFNLEVISDEDRRSAILLYGSIFKVDSNSGWNNESIASLPTTTESSSSANPGACAVNRFSANAGGALMEDLNTVAMPSGGAGSSLVDIAPTVDTLISTNAISNKAATTKPANGVIMAQCNGYSVASLGGNMSCVFNSTVSQAASKWHDEIVDLVLMSRELEKNGFDEAFDEAVKIVLLDGIEELRLSFPRFAEDWC